MWHGAVFFDYDGTLVDKKQGVLSPTAGTQEAIEQLGKSGYLAILCTGRALCYIPEKAKNLAFDGWITNNGAYAKMGGNVLFNEQLDLELVRSFTQACEKQNISYLLEGPDACYYRALSPAFEEFLRRFDIHSENFYPIEQAENWNFNKMIIAYDKQGQEIEIEREFGDRLVLDRHVQFTSCDVSQKGVNKGTGVKQFLAQMDLPLESAYAIGDSDNDLEMIKAAGTGIAMAQHSPRLGKVADYVTDSVKKDGVAKALAHFRLVPHPLFR